MNSFQFSPLHVAQQSRRDRLRFNQISPVENPDLPHLTDMPNHSPANHGSTFVGGDGQNMFSSGLLLPDFSAGSQSNHPTDFLMAAAASVGGDGDWTFNCASHGYNNGYDHHLTSSSTFDSNCSGQGHRQFDLTQLQPFGSSSSSTLYDNVLHSGKSPPTSLDNGNHQLASIVRHTQMTTSPWMDVGSSNSELALLPNSNLNSSRVSNNTLWVTRETQNCCSSGGLSLSLSSSFPTDVPINVPYSMRFQAEEAYPLNPIPPTCPIPKISLPQSSNPSSSIRNPPIQEGVMGSSADNIRVVGPLGPFTGYATILKASKYLKPAQQLLDESCIAAVGSKLSSSSDSCRMSFLNGKDVNFSDGTSVTGVGGGSKEGEGSSGGCITQIHQNKANLLFMKGEVCRRYRHYNQQMQMVISSFESVAGLSTAMPFLAMALKMISKHFRFLRNAISDQLQSVSRVLGEEFVESSPTPPTKVESSLASGLKFFDQTFRKQMEEGNGLGLMEHNQPVWRPQRGLPERAVAVLRAWLFDHFLHPYPTDTDKLMLANQTGLSRNQVSNWFINARVRVWKPMVEEIHLLETKGLAEVDLNSSKLNIERRSSSSSSMLNQQEHQHPKVVTVVPNCLEGTGQWHQDKRTRIEDIQQQQVMADDGGMASFPSYPGGFDMGELGGVSLTLGLRREDESNRQQQIRSYFGTHLVQEFVG